MNWNVDAKDQHWFVCRKDCQSICNVYRFPLLAYQCYGIRAWKYTDHHYKTCKLKYKWYRAKLYEKLNFRTQKHEQCFLLIWHHNNSFEQLFRNCNAATASEQQMKDDTVKRRRRCWCWCWWWQTRQKTITIISHFVSIAECSPIWICLNPSNRVLFRNWHAYAQCMYDTICVRWQHFIFCERRDMNQIIK